MNRTLTCLLGLFLAAPLAAQHDHERQSVEQHAAELLRMSAEKAAAGHESAAAELALKAAAMLKEQAEVHRAHALDAVREASREQEAVERQLVELERTLNEQAVEQEHANQELHEIIIVKDHDGNVIKLNGEDLELGEHLIELEHLDKQLIELKSLGKLGKELGEMEFQVMVSPDGPDGLFEVIQGQGPHGEHEIHTWESDGHHYTPMDGGDLHQELRAIHKELKQLRHELKQLRSSMHGGKEHGMRGGDWKGSLHETWPHARYQDGGERHGMFFPEGNMFFPEGGMRIMRAPRGRMEFAVPHAEMRVQGLPHDFNEQIREEVMKNIGMAEGMHDTIFGLVENGQGFGGEDFDFDFEIPEGVETHSHIKVIINGEVFEGDEARMKLEEMKGGEGHGRMKMRMMPAPPEPPKAPTRGDWRRSEGHEDL
ncbi:MAG: hypothetical protein ACYTEP_04310 [Planctomycetota bacterium]